MAQSDKLEFAHRGNNDGTIDSICRRCFITVATAAKLSALEWSERRHISTRTGSWMRLPFNFQHLGLILAIAIILWTAPAGPQSKNVPVPRPLSTEQLVEAMQRHDQQQSSELRQYQALRHYSIVYRGFMRTATAGMDVEVDYQAASGKSFRVISQNGSATLCQKVLKRALESEREASLDKVSTALSAANYRFSFAGNDLVADRPAYVLDVAPITPSKFLYRGKIWVDATDFAVAKMEVQPAKNPSFWVSSTTIHHTNKLTGGFWLPEENRSETKIRMGGTAVMTIDYGTYRIVPQRESTTSALLPSDR